MLLRQADFGRNQTFIECAKQVLLNDLHIENNLTFAYMNNITFDVANFWNTLIGAILGGLISTAISYYFFRMSKPLEKLTSWMAYNTGESQIRQAMPQFFGPKSTSYVPLGKC